MVERRRAAQENPQPDENGRVKERNFDSIPSHFGGVSLLTDRGEEPDLTRSDTRKLLRAAQTYFGRDEQIKALQKLQEDEHEELVSLAVNYPGLRGIRNINDGFEVQITPETSDVFDAKLLNQSLGEDRSKYVHDTSSITIDLNPEKIDKTSFLNSLKRMLKRRGFSNEQIAKQLKEKFGFRVDKDALQKAVIAKKVSLLPGAWGKEITVWKVVPRAITPKSKIEETEEVLRATKPQ